MAKSGDRTGVVARHKTSPKQRINLSYHQRGSEELSPLLYNASKAAWCGKRRTTFQDVLFELYTNNVLRLVMVRTQRRNGRRHDVAWRMWLAVVAALFIPQQAGDRRCFARICTPSSRAPRLSVPGVRYATPATSTSSPPLSLHSPAYPPHTVTAGFCTCLAAAMFCHYTYLDI